MLYTRKIKVVLNLNVLAQLRNLKDIITKHFHLYFTVARVD